MMILIPSRPKFRQSRCSDCKGMEDFNLGAQVHLAGNQCQIGGLDPKHEYLDQIHCRIRLLRPDIN